MPKKTSLSVLIFLLLLILACNLPTNRQSSALDIQQAVDSTNTHAAAYLAGTVILETQMASALAATLAAINPEPAPTGTPEPQPAAAVTDISSTPRLTVSIETYCRKGPGTVYESLGILPVGQPADVIARSEYSDDWLIRMPSNLGVTCWVYGKYASVSGDVQSIPRVTPPPTPTPFMDFEAQYIKIVSCFASYALRFNVLNTGQAAWESIMIILENHTRGVTDTYTSDDFQAFVDVCGSMESDYPALLPGNLLPVTSVSPKSPIGGVGHLNYDPAGENFTVTVMLCSEDGLFGTCSSEIFDLVP